MLVDTETSHISYLLIFDVVFLFTDVFYFLFKLVKYLFV